MLSSFLTPLRARFDLSPRTPTHPPHVEQNDDDLAPEDFARDVIIELMRNSVENLKTADDRRSKAEILTEIQRIMLQESKTKEVFKELDGFLVIMSVLSTIRPPPTSLIVEPEEQVLVEVLEVMRSVFMILAEAMNGNPDNEAYFRAAVGYESLANALEPLVSDSKTVDTALGFLLSLALHDFSVSGTFTSLRGASEDEIEFQISQFRARLGIIQRPDAIGILWKFVPRLLSFDGSRYGVYKLLETLSIASHRNQAIMSTLNLVSPILEVFISSRESSEFSEKERGAVQKLLKRLLDMGSTPLDTRFLFQKAVKNNQTLDSELLDIIRSGMKSKWLEHISMEGSSTLTLSQDAVRGLPVSGFTFSLWMWVEKLPTSAHNLFTMRISDCVCVSLNVTPEGKLILRTSPNRDGLTTKKAVIHKGKWTYVTIVHYPHRISNPTIRLFVDGVLNEAANWAYPKAQYTNQIAEYVIGDDCNSMSWCIASAFLASVPLADDVPRLTHHLGPRYCGNFQDTSIVKFLTYEASTSLNMFLATIATSPGFGPLAAMPIMKAVRNGIDLPEHNVIFSLSTINTIKSGAHAGIRCNNSLSEFKSSGDILVVKVSCMDMSLWKIGGAPIMLKLLQVANSAHEISRAIGIFADGLRNNWQNSEDMERLRGYEIVADILRSRSQMINMTSFETLFEFLGISFRSPEQSTIINTVAYKAIALDFELWACARKDIQRVYLEHFITLLETSRYKKFNIKQRFSKIGLVRQLLFVLQTDWYQQDNITFVIAALKAATRALFNKEDAIKPLIAYLAANLHDDFGGAASPRSVISRIDYNHSREKAEMVLDMLISTLSVKAYHTNFSVVLPLHRICLLLLGDRPSSFVATEILRLISISIEFSSSFIRKFEMISGWNVLKTILPFCWDVNVNAEAFKVLLGQTNESDSDSYVVVCPQIMPTILSALDSGLSEATKKSSLIELGVPRNESADPGSPVEELLERLLTLQASSATFRQIFQSQLTTQVYVDAFKNFVSKVTAMHSIGQPVIHLLEKLAHFGITLALDNVVAGSHKQEILEAIQKAEAITSPTAEKTFVDPTLVGDNRSVRQRFSSARFSRQVGERTVLKTIARMIEWRKTIQGSEKKRLRKNVLDFRENRRQVSRLYDWTYLLTSERGLWPKTGPRMWRLDETEGPQRIRKKMEPENDAVSATIRIDGTQQVRAIEAPERDSNSALVQLEVPPWAESYEVSSTDMEDSLAEDIADDKHRRVRHELEPGDIIEAVATVARVAGVDSSPGLLIIGRTHLYMLDGLVENDDGEVIDAHDAPRRLFFVPGSVVELNYGSQKAERWSREQITACSNKTFLFRDVALEIYFKDSRSLLIVFLDKRKRLDMDQRLANIVSYNTPRSTTTPGILRTPLFGRVSALLQGLQADQLSSAQRKWQAREISNYTYLSILNQISGRTPSDATQYPVFPWVLQDYSSRSINLALEEVYRDLSKPMGALTEERREAARTRYSNLESVDEKPFHYGTHFSSSMIVCHFLIRMAPFTHMFKTLQGGDWDLPDRLFSNVARAYESAAHDIRGDVRELIPEFYTCPEFLENSANLDFGVGQNSGEKVHNVKLPLWAKQDPLLFVVTNRKALESQYVSENLPAWIDLIWGYKQRDPESLNVFHPLSYEGSIDLDSITDELEREATVGIIHNFGQTPRKLFAAPHPHRYTHGLSSLPIGISHGIEEDPHLLVQGSRSFNDLGPSRPVQNLVFDMIGERIIPCAEGEFYVPLHPHEKVVWGSTQTGGDELRVLVDQKVVQVIEAAFVTCVAFADSTNLVTGSSDYTIRLWKLSRDSGNLRATLFHILRMHTDAIVCIAASRAWSMIVSGSDDGTAGIWDLNRGVYVRSIEHDDPVYLVDINESTGYVASCSRSKLQLHTINARPIATLDLTKLPSYSPLFPTIMSLAFHEREYSHLGILATGSADGYITLHTWTADGTPDGVKAQWEFVTIRTMKVRAMGRGPTVTALKFLGESLCHGEETGKSFLWSLPDY